jgi:carboxymethylenebutenolidase
VTFRAKTISLGIASAPSLAGFFADPQRGKRPGLIVLQEIFGVNMAMQAETLVWAREGYVTLAPDLFHRQKPGVALPYTEEGRAQGFAFWDSLDDTSAVADIAASANWLRAQPNCNGQIAAVGFCLGGKLAILAAATGLVDAAVSFYPVKMQEQRAAMQTTQVPVQVHLGSDDSHVPEDVIAMIRADLGSRPPHDVQAHPGAGHGFHNAFRTFGFHAEAAARAFGQTRSFLARALAHDGDDGARQG